MNNVVVYTSVTGGYDKLPQYEVLDPDFDYICFSNDFPPGSQIGQWKIRPIPAKSRNLTRLSRYVKLNPHKVLQEYEYSLWIDSNILITSGSVYRDINKRIAERDKWYGIVHPLRDCIYEEAEICIEMGKSGYIRTKKQIQFLKNNHYPFHFGLFENNMILRKHNDSQVINIDEEWWCLFCKYSARDQLSLFFVFWKHRFIPSLLFDNKSNTRNRSGLKYLYHHSSLKRSILTKLRIICNKIFRSIDLN